MFKYRSKEMELMDDISLTGDALKKNLKELEICNRVFGSNKALIDALNLVIKKNPEYVKTQKNIVVADLGCGGGDQLHIMDNWAASKNIKMKLIAFDINPFMLEQAKTKFKAINMIEYKALSMLSTEFAQMEFDIITVNSVTHHFDDKTLVTLFQQLAKQAKLAVIVNDLHRHWFSYYGIKILTRLFNTSYLIKSDGPLSVLRAFRKHELISLLQQANINSFSIQWKWLFRWVVIIWCKNRKEKT